MIDLLDPGALWLVALFAVAAAITARHTRIERENLEDLEERARARARAHEGIARHDTRPWVDIDVTPRRRK